MRFIFFVFLLIFGARAHAQSQDLSPQWELGASVGRLLPSQVDGVDEVMSLGGAHLGYRLVPMVYTQAQLYAGNGKGQKWKSLGLSLRLDQPLEDFLVSIYAGARSTLSSGPGVAEKNVTGAFVGGGLLAATGGPTWLKLDMDFGFGPGTTLFISLGLLVRF